jgi:hypothetical protein
MSGSSRHRVARWIGLATVAVLALGVGVAWRQWAPRPSAPARDPSSAEPVREALAQAEPDERSRWVDPVPGADVSALDEPRRVLFLQLANARRCTCGCGYTLAACRAYDASCDVSLPRVEALLDSVRRGLVRAAPDARADAPGTGPAGR